MSRDYTLRELTEINRLVAHAFDAHERRAWSLEVIVVELTKQVGDLARAVLTKEGFYLADRDSDPRYGGPGDKVADELADILYCVMRIADHYAIDLETAHLIARRTEWNYINPREVPPWEAPS